MLLPSGIPEGSRRRRSLRRRRPALHGSFPYLLRCNDSSSTGRAMTNQYNDEPACVQREDVSQISSQKSKVIWNGKGKGIIFDSAETSKDEVKPLAEVSSSAMCNHIIWKHGQLSNQRSNVHTLFGMQSIIQDLLCSPPSRNNGVSLAPQSSESAEIAEQDSRPAQALKSVNASMISRRLDEVEQPNIQDSFHGCIGNLKVRRKRKLNVRFNELASPEKPKGNMRRLKIMRHLGLIAPVGSPFGRLPH